MKLLVDVSKEDYEVIINHCDDYVKSLYNEPEERCILAVKNGIPFDKIRAEIDSITPKATIRYGKLSVDSALMIPLDKVLTIIDKHSGGVSK